MYIFKKNEHIKNKQRKTIKRKNNIHTPDDARWNITIKRELRWVNIVNSDRKLKSAEQAQVRAYMKAMCA